MIAQVFERFGVALAHHVGAVVAVKYPDHLIRPVQAGGAARGGVVIADKVADGVLIGLELGIVAQARVFLYDLQGLGGCRLGGLTVGGIDGGAHRAGGGVGGGYLGHDLQGAGEGDGFGGFIISVAVAPADTPIQVVRHPVQLIGIIGPNGVHRQAHHVGVVHVGVKGLEGFIGDLVAADERLHAQLLRREGEFIVQVPEGEGKLGGGALARGDFLHTLGQGIVNLPGGAGEAVARQRL